MPREWCVIHVFVFPGPPQGLYSHIPVEELGAGFVIQYILARCGHTIADVRLPVGMSQPHQSRCSHEPACDGCASSGWPGRELPQQAQHENMGSRRNSYPPDAMAACSRRDSLRNPRGEATRSILEVPRIPISIVGELRVDSLGVREGGIEGNDELICSFLYEEEFKSAPTELPGGKRLKFLALLILVSNSNFYQ